MNEKNEQASAGVASELNAELDRSKFENLLAKAVQIANERDGAAWQIIRKMIPIQTPENFPQNHTLFVGSIAHDRIENTLKYVPLFVKRSILLGSEQVCLVSNFIGFEKRDINYL